jgi:hypothetical protein
MSTEVFERAKAREAKIYSHTEVDLLRAAGHQFVVKAIENTRLDLEGRRIRQDIYVLTEYELLKMAQLDYILYVGLGKISSDRLVLVARIASKRVIKQYDYALRQKKLTVKEYSNLIADELMLAKESALAIYEAENEILTLKVQLYIQETTLKIEELQAKIQEEGLNLKKAEMEVVEAELEVQKTALKITREILRVLEIQVEIFNVLYEITYIGVKVAGVRADIAELTSSIERTKVSKYKLDAEKEQFRVEIEGIAKKLAQDILSIGLKTEMLAEEEVASQRYYDTISVLITAELAEQIGRIQIKRLLNQVILEGSSQDVAFAIKDSQLSSELTTMKQTEMETDQQNTLLIDDEKENNMTTRADIIIQAAEAEAAEALTATVQHKLLFGTMPRP